MSRLTAFLSVLAVLGAALVPLRADELSARARIDPAVSSITAVEAGIKVDLSLSQPVAWRAFTLADPPRLVIDFREVDWSGTRPEALLATGLVRQARAGTFRPGWSRLVLELSGRFTLTSAVMETDAAGGGARLDLRLDPAGEATFRAASGAPQDPVWTVRIPPAPAPQRDGPLTVVLDPGHGGLDPGAEGAGVTEAELMLIFARELKEELVRAGFGVVLTRSEDVFVPLDARISRARAAGADVFLSLHADAVPEGRAIGATVYTLSETATDEASAALAERHDRADLLAGVDLSGHDDVIADVLMDIARIDTAPRSAALADAIVAGLDASVGGLHKRPRLEAGFSVLRAPDIPSVLVELGFISSPEDRDRLSSAEWRRRAAQGIAGAISDWHGADAARASLLRQ